MPWQVEGVEEGGEVGKRGELAEWKGEGVGEEKAGGGEAALRRRLVVLDRVGFTVKLANGEHFSPQTAEAAFEER